MEENGDVIELTESLTKWRACIMGMAGIAILFFHNWFNAFSSVPFWGRVEYLLRNFGVCGVDVFFFLSAFGLTFAFRKSKSILSFYLRRIKRLLPSFIIATAVASLVLGWDAETRLCSFLPIKFFTVGYNQWLWFVWGILILYILFPFYYKGLEYSRRPRVFTATAILIWFLYTVTVGERLASDELSGFTNRIPVFLTGAYFGYMHFHGGIKCTRAAYIPMALSLIAGLFMYSQCILHNFSTDGLIPDFKITLPAYMIAISSSLLIAAFFGRIDRAIKGRTAVKIVTAFFTFFGKLSLELYCVQEFIGEKLRSVLDALIPTLPLNIITIVSSVAAAVILYWVRKGIFSLVGFVAGKIKSGNKNAE